MKRTLIVVGFAFALTGGSAFAQEGEEAADALDVTMTVIPEGAELPDVVTAAIELPRDEAGEYIPNESAVEHSAHGLETANAAREDGRAFGEATAAAAKENREDVARGARPDLGELLPDQVPNVPELPNLPDHAGPPGAPGQN